MVTLTFVSACGGDVADTTNTAGDGVGGRGAAIGGQGTSGNSAIGGQGGSAMSTGGASALVCTSASDCALADGCCACMAYRKGQDIADCAMACSQTACAKMGVTVSDVTCVAGRCVLSKSCDARLVTCNSAPPTCPAGQTAVVENGCYGAICIPVDQCTAVTSCSACDAAGLACVTDQKYYPNDYHCISVSSDCGHDPTCECLGACKPYLQCADPNSTELICGCPMC